MNKSGYVEFIIYFFVTNEGIIRSSRLEMLCKKGVLKNFTKFTGKHLYWRHFIKKEILSQVFSCELCKIFKNIYFYRTSAMDDSLWYNFIKFLNQNINTFSQWTRFVKLFTCDYTLDILIVLLILEHLFWHFDRVLMDCFIVSNAFLNKENCAE